MSRNISLIFNILLSIAVIILFYLHFNDQGSEAVAEDHSKKNDAKSDSSLFDGIGVYYVNTDSLSINYKFAKELDKTLKEKREQSRIQFESAVKKFEDDVRSFQEKSRFMTQMEGQKKQEELVQRERELAKLEKDLSERLMEDQEKLNLELRKKILDHIRESGKKRKFLYVLGYSEIENNILVAHDSLDITNEILQGLNAEYDSTREE